MSRIKTLHDCKSGQDIVRHTAKQGVEWRNGKGSHMVGRIDEYRFVVPLHRELRRGTKAAIIKAMLAAGITVVILSVLIPCVLEKIAR